MRAILVRRKLSRGGKNRAGNRVRGKVDTQEWTGVSPTIEIVDWLAYTSIHHNLNSLDQS